MIYPVDWYRLHDSSPSGAIQIDPSEAKDWNEKGYGIFKTVNSFRGARRNENLVGINAWAIDMDGGDKNAQLERIKSGLVPTLVVETKNGYHVYFAAKDATAKNFKSIMVDRLVPFYKADPRAKDLARILRAPGFLHQKNPAAPFLVKKVWEAKISYFEKDLLAFFPDANEEARTLGSKSMEKCVPGSSSEFWDVVYNMDCMEALQRVSGHECVGFETYEFRSTSRGAFNIFVNGKSSSCWVDAEGRIGSTDNGGPTIAMWINWFHKDWSKTVGYMKEIFKELPWQK